MPPPPADPQLAPLSRDCGHLSLIVLALFTSSLVACLRGDDDDLGPAEFDSGISIEEALTRAPGETVTVNGWLADTPRNPSAAPQLCTSLRRPQPFDFECVGPSMVVLLNIDRYPGIERVDATTWVDEPVQITGKIVRPPGRAAEIDPFNCLEDFNDRCRLPTWHQFPAANPSPEATTERRALTPPAATATDVAMVPIPAPTTFRGYPADLLMITTFDGARRPVSGQRDIEAAVPWPIVLPAYLPPGYDRIGLVQVDQPMPNLPPDAAARNTRVMVAFRGSQPGPNFSLILGGGHVGTDATERLEVNGRPPSSR